MNGSDYSTTTLPLLFVFISFVVTFLVNMFARWIISRRSEFSGAN